MSDDQHWLQFAVAWLMGEAGEGRSALKRIAQGVQIASPEELDLVLDIILEKWEVVCLHPTRIRGIAQVLASHLITSASSQKDQSNEPAQPLSAELLDCLYDRLLQVEPTGAAHVLQCLAAQDDDPSLRTLVDILKDRPPEQWQVVGIGLSPLWNAGREKLERFFATVEEGLTHPSTMPVLLDLANHAYRARRLSPHPFSDREPTVRQLLADVVVRLEKLESDPSRYGERVEEIQQVLADGLSLTQSLSDALGLIGQPTAASVLAQAMELSHRRVQVEAAAALVRLGDSRGKQRLIELAADTVARSRVVQYAEELDISSEIDEQYRFPQALAESELAAWLASPAQFGLPPNSIQHVDWRTLYWPGYEEPRDCYLFRFQYELPGGSYTNLGMAGPLVHAFPASLDGMTVEDVYAAFAGWHAEHEEIFEVPADKLNSVQRSEARRLELAFRRDGYQVEELLALTFLLGEPSLLAQLRQEDRVVVAVTDGQETTCFAVDETPLANSPDLVLAIHRGRKLLRAFNG